MAEKLVSCRIDEAVSESLCGAMKSLLLHNINCQISEHCVHFALPIIGFVSSNVDVQVLEVYPLVDSIISEIIEVKGVSEVSFKIV